MFMSASQHSTAGMGAVQLWGCEPADAIAACRHRSGISKSILGMQTAIKAMAAYTVLVDTTFQLHYFDCAAVVPVSDACMLPL